MSELWWFGDEAEKIPSLKVLRAHNLRLTRACQSNSSRTRKVMTFLVQACVQDSKITTENDINEGNYVALFDYTFPKLIAQKYTTPPARPNDLNVNTVANRLGKRVVM